MYSCLQFHWPKIWNARLSNRTTMYMVYCYSQILLFSCFYFPRRWELFDASRENELGDIARYGLPKGMTYEGAINNRQIEFLSLILL